MTFLQQVIEETRYVLCEYQQSLSVHLWVPHTRLFQSDSYGCLLLCHHKGTVMVKYLKTFSMLGEGWNKSCLKDIWWMWHELWLPVHHNVRSINHPNLMNYLELPATGPLFRKQQSTKLNKQNTSVPSGMTYKRDLIWHCLFVPSKMAQITVFFNLKLLWLSFG